MSTVKEQLYKQCCDYVRKREEEVKKLVADAQEASGNETKSSAGDKYETAREMMQQEINMNLSRLNELSRLSTTLERIDPSIESDTVQTGSVVVTDKANFYIAISAGVVDVSGTKYYVVSAASPIGAKMLGRQAGYTFTLNGKEFVINDIL